jgi:demethylmenaquinone methyltransferase/2-methoxy-6-polyprenyl-1,4-benzoquinol methylase
MASGLHRIFDDIAPRYELINHAMTLGLDRSWRRRAVSLIAPKPGERRLDVCCGTGETVLLLQHAAPADLAIGADFSQNMLRLAAQKPDAENVRWVMCEAGGLPFADGSFDLVTVTFATRNLQSSAEGLEGCFGEFWRVLKPGGRFVNVETSQPRSALVRWGFHLYVGVVVPLMARMLSGKRAGYAYLAASIPRFHGAEALAEVLRGVGFTEVAFERLLLGAAAVHVARKT